MVQKEIITQRALLDTMKMALEEPEVQREFFGADGKPSANNRINFCCIGLRNQGGGLLNNVLGNPQAGQMPQSHLNLGRSKAAVG